MLNGRKSIINLGICSGNNFLTNICDSDFASPKFRAVSLVCKIFLINDKNIIRILFKILDLCLYMYIILT